MQIQIGGCNLKTELNQATGICQFKRKKKKKSKRGSYKTEHKWGIEKISSKLRAKKGFRREEIKHKLGKKQPKTKPIFLFIRLLSLCLP